MGTVRNYTDLIVWQKAHQLTLEIYSATKMFPRDEKFGLTQQVRRSVASVATNIAEGFGRSSRNEFVRFLHISRGSLLETDYHLRLSLDLEYLSFASYKNLKALIIETGKMLNGLIKSLKSTNH